MNCQKKCKNEAKEKFIRIQTNGQFLFKHVRKGDFKGELSGLRQFLGTETPLNLMK